MVGTVRQTILMFGMLVVSIIGFIPRVNLAHAADLPIYGDALASGWADWSWNTTVQVTTTSPVHTGSHSISVGFDAA